MSNHYLKASVQLNLTFVPLDICKEYDFITGNIIKYILRYKYKGQALSDLKKALDYMSMLKPHEPITLKHDNLYFFVGLGVYKKDNFILDALINSNGSINKDNIKKTSKCLQVLIDEMKHNESFATE